jgi:hypothetical protein
MTDSIPAKGSDARSVRTGRIVGDVSYREGDGPQMPIRRGVVEITETAQDVTLGWADGDSRGSSSMPVADYRRYLASGAIVLDAPSPPSADPPAPGA